MKLDLTNIAKDKFSMAICSEMYDDFIGEFKEIPTEIHIRSWQRSVLTGGPDPDHPTWRGVPLVTR